MVDLKTLTKEQLQDIENWYEYILNEDLKLQKIHTEKSNIYEIEKEFQDSINKFSAWYSQAEIDSWTRKVEEAKLYIETWTSAFITWLCIQGENESDLAEKILANSDLFATTYVNAEQIKRQKLKDLTI